MNCSPKQFLIIIPSSPIFSVSTRNSVLLKTPGYTNLISTVGFSPLHFWCVVLTTPSVGPNSRTGHRHLRAQLQYHPQQLTISQAKTPREVYDDRANSYTAFMRPNHEKVLWGPGFANYPMEISGSSFSATTEETVNGPEWMTPPRVVNSLTRQNTKMAAAKSKEGNQIARSDKCRSASQKRLASRKIPNPLVL